MKHTLKDWFLVTRPWSFPVSLMPVVSATAFMIWKGYDVNYAAALLAMAGVVIFHFAGNVLSDWFDYRRGVDNERAYAIPNLVFHHFEPGEYLKYSIMLFVAGIVIGIVLCIMTGWELLYIGLAGFLLAASYSFFKYNAMGDIFVFGVFGVLLVTGTSLVTAGIIDWTVLCVSVPLGIMTVAVLHNNNTVDIASDRDSGIHTVPMALGEKVSVVLYIVYMTLPYIAVLAACILGYMPWLAMLCWISCFMAAGNIRSSLSYFSKGREAIMGLDQKTAQMHLLFSLLLSAGLLLASIR